VLTGHVETSEVASRLSGALAGRTDNALNLSNGALEVIVHHDDIGNFGAEAFFVFRLSKPLHHVFFRVSPALQAAALLFPRWWLNEDKDGIWMTLLDLGGTVQFNLQHNVSAVGNLWHGSSVQIAQEFGPLKKSASSNMVFELLASDEHISI
jgi:hypothetical protein